MKNIHISREFHNGWTDPDSEDSFVLLDVGGVRERGIHPWGERFVIITVGITLFDFSFGLTFEFDPS
jgi:hypothetical protein